MSIAETKVREIAMSEIVALPVWMGGSVFGPPDLEKFYNEYGSNRRFATYPVQVLRDVSAERLLREVQGLIRGIKKTLDGKGNAAIFYIVTAELAECKWFSPLRNVVAKEFPGHVAYTIIFGGGFKEVQESCGSDNPFNSYERRAQELGAVCSYYDCNAPATGMARLVGMLNTIMGVDLPELKFPGLDYVELCMLSWLINRERFDIEDETEKEIPENNVVQPASMLGGLA